MKVLLTVFTLILWANLSFAQILTTAEKTDFQRTNDYKTTISLCKQLAQTYDIIDFQVFGKSAGGYDLPLLVVDRDKKFKPGQQHKKAVLLIQADIHAGETAGNDAGFMFIRDLVEKHPDLLKNLTVLFIPVLNADGLNRFGPYNRINQNGPQLMGWRTNAKNLNLNRDYLKAETPEIQAWLQLFNAWNPDFFIDLHTTDGADFQYVITYDLPQKAILPAPLGNWIYNVYLPALKTACKQNHLLIHPYVMFRHWGDPTSGLRGSNFSPMYSTGYVAARNRPALLLEAHALKTYKQRVMGDYFILLKTAAILSRNAQNLLYVNRQSDSIVANFAKTHDSITITYKFSPDSTVENFLGYRFHYEKSPVTGHKYIVYNDTPQTYQMPVFNHLIADKKVKIPQYYVVPRQWHEVIQIIKRHGIKYKTLDSFATLRVHTYKFSNVTFARQPYEGHQRVLSFDADTITVTQVFGPGSILIPTNQPLATLIYQILEPLAPSSLLHWGYFNTIFEQKEYAEIYTMEPLAQKLLQSDPELKTGFERWKNSQKRPPSQWQQINWLYNHSQYADKKRNIYPVGKIW